MERLSSIFSVTHIVICLIGLCAVAVFTVVAVKRIKAGLLEKEIMQAYTKRAILLLLIDEGALTSNQITGTFEEGHECLQCRNMVLACLNDLVYDEKYVDANHDGSYSISEQGREPLLKVIGSNTAVPANSLIRSTNFDVSGDRRRTV
jgi:hypothetical protein